MTPIQEELELSVIKLLREVDDGILYTEQQIEKLEGELVILRQNLLLLEGKSEAFTEALVLIQNIQEGGL